jgi:hypothetical protein
MNKITSFLSIALLGTCCVLYPYWWKEGYLEDWYLKISVAVAAYGGLIANIVWLKQNGKK